MTKLEAMWQRTRETVGDGRLSVVMPLYRLAAEASENLRRVAGLFERHGVNAELVPVDDGSDDGTGEALREFRLDGCSHVTVKPVICASNAGKGAALRAGFEASSGRYVLLLDGDLDIDPAQVPKFFEQMRVQGADIVIGSKRHPRSVVRYPWHRRVVSACYFAIVRLMFGMRISDTQTGMKLFRREALGDALSRMLVKQYAFDLELLAIAAQRGAKIAEAPVVISFAGKFGALRPSTVRKMAVDTLAVFYRLRVLDYYAKCLVPPRSAETPLVSVVIACPRASWMLEEGLSAIRRQTYANWEVIVLPDAEGEVASAAGDRRIRFIATGAVRPAEKRNVGIREARGEIVAFLDDDAYPDPRWIEFAVRYFADPAIGAVGGPGVTPPGDSLLARLGGRVYESRLVSGPYVYRYRAGGVRRDVTDYPSCNLFVRRSVLEEIGGYRTDFWPGEDTLLCADIADGWNRIVYDPWVVVYHHRRPLFLPHLRQMGRYGFHRGYFCRRFPTTSRKPSYFVPTLFVAYLALLAALSAVCLAARAWHPALMRTAYAPLALYAVLVALASFSIKPHCWLLTAAGMFLSHVWYGVEFAHGLFAKRAPCETIGRDHAIK